MKRVGILGDGSPVKTLDASAGQPLNEWQCRETRAKQSMILEIYMDVCAANAYQTLYLSVI